MEIIKLKNRNVKGCAVLSGSIVSAFLQPHAL